jgi:hypothetical protein
MFFPAAALFIGALTPAHAYTIAFSTYTDSASYTGASLDKAVAFDPDIFGLGQVFVGSGVGFSNLPVGYAISDGSYSEQFSNAFIERDNDSLKVFMSGDLFYNKSLVGTADALFDLSQTVLGSPVSLSFADVASSNVAFATSPMSTPEASTWMMIGLGFAALGFAGWRKRAVESVNI